jgi:hypothetical protein
MHDKGVTRNELSMNACKCIYNQCEDDCSEILIFELIREF